MSNPTLDLKPDTISQAIQGMALAFNPDQAKGLTASIQFHITDKERGDWYLDIADGRCRCERGVIDKPSLTITAPAQVWLAVVRGDLKGSIGLMTGKYKAKGNMGLLLRMDSIFSRELTAEDIANQDWQED
jgi:putative sterol carrier protein